jgi:hypothetical protein
LRAFRQGLGELRYEEGRNLVVERWAKGCDELLPSLAADLVRADVSIIAAPGALPPRWPQKQRRRKSQSSLRSEPIRSRRVWSRT